MSYKLAQACKYQSEQNVKFISMTNKLDGDFESYNNKDWNINPYGVYELIYCIIRDEGSILDEKYEKKFFLDIYTEDF